MPDRILSEQEFNQVRNAVLASAPPNMDEATFNRWIGPQMAGALQQAELTAAPQGSAAGRFVSNAAAMLNPVTMASGLYQAVRHPIDTGTAIVGQMGEQLGQAKDAYQYGRYSEAAGH